jgi:hypothetical protein
MSKTRLSNTCQDTPSPRRLANALPSLHKLGAPLASAHCNMCCSSHVGMSRPHELRARAAVSGVMGRVTQCGLLARALYTPEVSVLRSWVLGQEEARGAMSCMVAPSVLKLREFKFSGPRDSTALGSMHSLCLPTSRAETYAPA